MQKREFGLIDGSEVYFVKPSVGILEKSEQEGIKRFNQLLLEGEVPTVTQLYKLLKEKGIISEDDVSKYKDLELIVSELSEEMTDANITKERQQEISYKIRNINADIYTNALEQKQFFQNTIEGLVDRHKRIFLIQNTLFNKDGSLYWKTMDDLYNESDDNIISMVTLEFALLMNENTVTQQDIEEIEMLNTKKKTRGRPKGS